MTVLVKPPTIISYFQLLTHYRLAFKGGWQINTPFEAFDYSSLFFTKLNEILALDLFQGLGIVVFNLNNNIAEKYRGILQKRKWVLINFVKLPCEPINR